MDAMATCMHRSHDHEWIVAHPQTRVSTLLRVRVRSAPVLLEEHPHPPLGRAEIGLGVERAHNLVLRDFFVKSRGELVKRLGSADGVVEGLLHVVLYVIHGKFHCA